MTKIRFKEDCPYGKLGEVKTVNDDTAYVLSLKGHVDIIGRIEPEKPKTEESEPEIQTEKPKTISKTKKEIR